MSDPTDYSITARTSGESSNWSYLKDGHSFGAFDPSGDVTGPGGAGLYYRDTRFLSRYELRVNGDRPALLRSSTDADGTVLQATLAGPKGIVIERHIYLFGNALNERLRVLNRGDREFEVRIEYAFAVDFADIFEVRGQFSRPVRGHLECRTGQGGVRFDYGALDGLGRSTAIDFVPAIGDLGPDRAERRLRLAAGESNTSTVTVQCRRGDEATSKPAFEAGLAALKRARAHRRAGAVRIQTSSERLNEWLRRCVADLYLLTTDTDQGLYPFAGLPWFSAPFGRDGIITALETLWLDPRIARGVLGYLAVNQAQEASSAHDSEPGKILHEARFGEMANLGEVPFGRYYGSADATPLFVVLAGEFFGRTGDRAFIERLWPHVEAALEWIDRFGDLDGDGFSEYRPQTERGLRNQGWKDSTDSVFHADGERAAGPIALVEIQGYVFAARRHAAALARVLGLDSRAESLERQAESLRRDFEHHFWSETLGSYALALDGAKRRCEVRASNQGHLLLAGIVAPERAAQVAELLRGPGFFSGWGVRTVAAGEARYDPRSYHNGSIWPHDNALIALGLARYGFSSAIDRLFEALWEASAFFESRRLPELYCGDRRAGGAGPVPYPHACAPQAWAAAAPLAMLGAMLGIAFDPARNAIRLDRPRLPAGLEWLRLRNLRLGTAGMDLTLSRGRHGVDARIDGTRGDVELEITAR